MSRYFNFHLAVGMPLALMAVLLVADPTALDFTLSRLFYLPGQGFIGKQHAWIEDLLHDRAKQLVIAFAVLAIIAFILSCLKSRWRPFRAVLGYVVLSLSVSTSIVPPLKTLTAVQCPWSLTEFGGKQSYSALLGQRPPTDAPGRCWPGGHASAGFSLIALFFALRDRRPRLARLLLAGAISLGSVFSVARMSQGAHFFSHNLWTFLFDWLICVLCYRWLLYRTQVPLGQPRKAATTSANAGEATLTKASHR